MRSKMRAETRPPRPTGGGRRQRGRLGLGLALALLASAPGCTEEDPPPYTGNQDFGWSWEALTWPDYGQRNDVYLFQRDQGVRRDGQPRDGAGGDAGSDASAACTGPTGVSCTPSCTSTELCTAAKSGTCVTTLQLKGPASNAPVLAAVANAYATCYARQPSADTLCFALDTCQMTGMLTENMVKSWMCTLATPTDLGGQSKYDAAYSACGCGFFDVYRPDWQITTIGANEKGLTCFTYDANSIFSYDRVNVDLCSKFPPL